MKISKFLKNLPAGRHGKRNIIWIIVLIIVIIGGYLLFGGKKANVTIQTGVVEKQNLKQTVLSTGQVVSETDLALSFQGTGVVRKVNVKEGDKVVKGQILATLDQASALATLTSAQGSLAQAQANYDKLIAGATNNEIKVQQDALELAKTNLSNVYNEASSVINNGYTAIFNAKANAKNIQDTYFTSADSFWSLVHENRRNIDDNLAVVQNSINLANVSGVTDSIISSFSNSLADVLTSLQIIRNQMDSDNYISRISNSDKTTMDSQKTAISSALSGVNSLQSSIASYKINIQSAENNLFVKKAMPRQEDIDLASAQVLSAQGQVDSARAVLNNTIIVAPSAGTITQVDIKVGEQAGPTITAITLQDIGNLYAEANVSEASIAGLEVGQTIDYTFDALGPDEMFTGKVLTINPASTVIAGVVNYKVKGSLENIEKIKPGMTVNMTVLVKEKNDALAVPSTAIISKDKKKYVRVINDIKSKTYNEVEVQTGLEADGGIVEILSGLTEGQEIVTYMKR